MQGNSAGVFKPHFILTDGHGLDNDRDPGMGKNQCLPADRSLYW